MYRIRDNREYLRRLSIVAVVFLWLGVVSDMAFIFIMSSQNREESKKMSENIVEFVAEKIDPEFKNYPKEKKTQVIGAYNHFARKTAHFCLYAIMGLLSATALQIYPEGLGCKKVTGVSQFICSLYAVTDELHQAIVPGRGPQVRDVILDSAGAFCGIVLSLLIVRTKLKNTKKALNKNFE